MDAHVWAMEMVLGCAPGRHLSCVLSSSTLSRCRWTDRLFSSSANNAKRASRAFFACTGTIKLSNVTTGDMCSAILPKPNTPSITVSSHNLRIQVRSQIWVHKCHGRRTLSSAIGSMLVKEVYAKSSVPSVDTKIGYYHMLCSTKQYGIPLISFQPPSTKNQLVLTWNFFVCLTFSSGARIFLSFSTLKWRKNPDPWIFPIYTFKYRSPSILATCSHTRSQSANCICLAGDGA